MTLHPRHVVLATTVCLAVVAGGCATAPSASALVAGSQATVDGTIAAIDTKPWTYDGNAVVLLDTAAHGRVSVQLPARWNLCKAGQVDVAALVVGRRARAVGTVTEDGGMVVCERAEHRLGPIG
jgi:hypothetical protein